VGRAPADDATEAATFVAKIPEGSRNYRWLKTASRRLKSSAFRKAKHAAKCLDCLGGEKSGVVAPRDGNNRAVLSRKRKKVGGIHESRHDQSG